MRGKVFSFDPGNGQGVITGEDGSNYGFTTNDLGGSQIALPGSVVEFSPVGGQATGISSVSSSAGTEKSKIVAGLLALFLGGLGIHKFYLGKRNAGIIMLLGSLLGLILLAIPTLIISLIAFIEAIIYFFKKDEKFQEDYIKGDRAWF